MLYMAFNGQGSPSGPRKAKVTPPEETSQEAAYLKLLGEKQKPVSIKLADGEVVHGWIEYYDKNMFRLTREVRFSVNAAHDRKLAGRTSKIYVGFH